MCIDTLHGIDFAEMNLHSGAIQAWQAQLALRVAEELRLVAVRPSWTRNWAGTIHRAVVSALREAGVKASRNAQKQGKK